MEAVLNLGLVVPHSQGKTFLCTFPSALGILVSSTADGTLSIPALCESWRVSSDLFMFFSWLWAVSSQICNDQYSTKYSGAGVGKTNIIFRFLKHCLIITCFKITRWLLKLQINWPYSRPTGSEISEERAW